MSFRNKSKGSKGSKGISTDQSPFEDRHARFEDSEEIGGDRVARLGSDRRNFSDESFRSARLASGSSKQSQNEFVVHGAPPEYETDGDSVDSVLNTPNLNAASPRSRRQSLRFQIPAASGTPPTSASGSSANDSHAKHTMHSGMESPFMDKHVILEDEVYDSKSPFADSNESTFVGTDNALEAPVNREATVTKRHRWGTMRNKKGRPQNDIGRSKTMKGLLQHNKSMLRSKSRKNRSRQGSIRKPNTGTDIPQDSDDDDSDNTPKDPRDKKEEKRSVVFNLPLPEEYLDPETGKPTTTYSRNKIRTTKYTPLTFLPKNIFNQFVHNIANIYFLVMNILGAFQIFGVPSPALAAVPLIVIVIITAIKDAIEDSRRTSSDLEINNQITHILGNNPSCVRKEYFYENPNQDEDKVSAWRRFKKLNSRLLFRFIAWSNRNLSQKGRAEKIRERNKDANEENVNQRKSFDSAYMVSPRPSGETTRRSFQHGRPSTSATERQLKFTRGYWKDVKVGDVIRVYSNEEIPADVVILSTSDADNCCYVETKNLDGETNLKVRQALKYGSVHQKIKKADDLVHHQFQIDSEGPHPNLYSYEGNLKYTTEGSDQMNQESISINNILLRGCTLRNTKWVVGIVVFTGDDTKIMLNAGITPTKQSRMSRELNYYVLMNFILLFIICFAAGLVNGLYYRTHHTSRDYFEFGTIAGTPAKNGIVDFFVALILYQSLVPISLYITIEIIKTAQVFFIYADLGMYYKRLDYPCTPKSWGISDDLGQIEYVFSDKTGTLTQNLMEFKKCTINGKMYGKAYTEAYAGLRKRQGIDVDAESAREREIIAKEKEEMVAKLKNISMANSQYYDDLTFISKEFVNDLTDMEDIRQKEADEHFMLALALCHSILVEEDPDNPENLLLKAQSPDELALVETARSLGFVFKGNTSRGVLVEIHGSMKEYQLLNTLEFNSTRKRMSAIIKIPSDKEDEEPKALLLCKGADSVIYDRLSRTKNDRDLLNSTAGHLESFATEGLRTLCIAQRELSWSEYTEWNARHLEASSSLDHREARMEEVASSIEQELVLLGGTAIEDRLQEGVPDSIETLSHAGIKLWVLTGDKVETAINIGFSCNLLGNDMELLIIKSSLSDEDTRKYGIVDTDKETTVLDKMISLLLRGNFNLEGTIEEVEQASDDHSPPGDGFGLVIDGGALKTVLNDKDIKRKFLLLCKQCKAVLCCRVSPAQKAAVVKLVKESLDVMTLAIGDGSNDVAMIQAANVGIGIVGEEGRQAAMSSDYAIGQFRFLTRLLLIHGRWSYKKFSEMIPSFFYKNVIFSIALFWYGVFSNFDGSYLFEFTYLTFYNLAFTSLPVIFLGIFDQDVPAKVSLLVPQLYRTGITRSEFTEPKFWCYMVDALYQSVISFFFPYLMYCKGFQNLQGLPLDHRFWMGISVICISCISCNIYILSHQYRWDWLSLLIVALSILVVYGWTGIWTSSMQSGEFYKAASQAFGSASVWACTFIGVLICLIPREFYDFVKKIYWPADVDIIRECVRRGDFDPYPDNYDPTDPERPKISNYTSETLRRMSMGAKSPPISSLSLGSTDLEHQPVPVHVHDYSGNRRSLSGPRMNEDEGQLSARKGMNDDEMTFPAQERPASRSSFTQRFRHNKRPLESAPSSSSHNAINLPHPSSQNTNRRSVWSRFSRNNNTHSFYDSGSLFDSYNATDSTSLRTEEIALEDFGAARPQSMSKDVT